MIYFVHFVAGAMQSTMSPMNFAQEIKKLNQRQRQAVEAIEGPVMVVAGPGTGKTQILTLRIANILKTAQVEPENILAITFTESGVAAMRKRLAELIGSEAYGVVITTFHAFCNNIIREHPEGFPRIIGAKAMTEVEQFEILEQVITKSKLKILRPFGESLFYIKDIAKAVDELKRENVSPEEFAKIAKAGLKDAENDPEAYHEKGKFKGQLKGEAAREIKRAQKNVELAQVYDEYQAALTKQKRYDYTDMIMEVVRVLAVDRDLRFEIQETYQYVLVDEHQDTNNAQNKLLELIMSFHKDPNLFVVGDAKQAIYRFQGASLENFLYFKKLYPRAQLIELTDNYRSTQHILDAAASVTRADQIELTARAKLPKRDILVAALSGEPAEQYFIAKHISERLASGVSPHEIALLYRNNKDALAIATMLERLNIPFTIESAQNIFDDPEIKKLRTLLTAIAKFGNHEFLAVLLYADFLKIDPLDAHRVVAYATTANRKSQSAKRQNETIRRLSIYDIIKSPFLLKDAGVGNPESFLKLYENLSRWRSAAQYHSAAEVFENAVQESGFLGSILAKQNSVDILHKLNVFFDELKDLAEQRGELALREFVEYLDMLDEHELLIKRVPAAHRQIGRVRLMTAHASKGQEFDYVYIIGAVDGHWGNKRKIERLKLPRKVYSLVEREAGEELDDDRNLFYVALTRARKEVVISYAKAAASGKEQIVSEFVSDIKSELLEQISVEAYEQELVSKPQLVYQKPQAGQHRIKEKEFVRELFMERGLSVTHLNNYLECPWKYFFTNLIRIPEAKNKHMMYGSAVHEALETLFNSFDPVRSDGRQGPASNGARANSKKVLLDAFKAALKKQPFAKGEFDEALAKGEKALSGYFNQYSKSWRNKVLPEFDVPGVQFAKDIVLNGKIDKLEILDSRNNVNVVDYKTGKAPARHSYAQALAGEKSRVLNDSQRKAANYRRQLAFYSLLLSLYKKGKYKMKTGEIDFIEPDEKGRYHKEQFVIDAKEVAELEREIKRVADEILELKFWDKECGEKDCKYCELRSFI